MGVKSPKCTPEIGYLRKDKRLGCLRHSKKKIVPLSVPHTLSILLPLFSHTFSCLPLFFSLVRGLPSAFKKKKTLTSFLFCSPSCLPFFEHTFTFFQLHGFPAPFLHLFTFFPFFEHAFTFFFTSPCSLLPFFS